MIRSSSLNGFQKQGSTMKKSTSLNSLQDLATYQTISFAESPITEVVSCVMMTTETLDSFPNEVLGSCLATPPDPDIVKENRKTEIPQRYIEIMLKRRKNNNKQSVRK